MVCVYDLGYGSKVCLDFDSILFHSFIYIRYIFVWTEQFLKCCFVYNFLLLSFCQVLGNKLCPNIIYSVGCLSCKYLSLGFLAVLNNSVERCMIRVYIVWHFYFLQFSSFFLFFFYFCFIFRIFHKPIVLDDIQVMYNNTRNGYD